MFDPKYSIFQRLVRWYYRIFLGLKIYGGEKLKNIKENIIVTANHRSFNDPPLIGTMLYDKKVCFIAREDLFTANPFFGWLLSFLQAIPIKPKSADKKALDEAIKRLNNGWNLVIFPEGTRNKKGGFSRGLPGTGYIALKTRKNVLPIYIENANEDYWKQFLRIKPIKVYIGDLYEIPDWEPTAKNSVKLTDEIMRRIKKLAGEE